MSTTATVAMSTDTERKPVTLHRLRRMLAEGEKIVMLTAYDASFARLADDAGVDCLLVGDSISDFRAARACNMPVMLVSYGYSQGLDLAELGPDAVIDSLAQVAELIELTEE